jgi:hypothetical protein
MFISDPDPKIFPSPEPESEVVFFYIKKGRKIKTYHFLAVYAFRSMSYLVLRYQNKDSEDDIRKVHHLTSRTGIRDPGISKFHQK